VVVCGDFNDTPVSYVYHKLRGDLKDAYVEAGRGLGGTYNGNLPSYRIDFILFDPSFEAYNYKRQTVKLSDHFPIMVTLDLK
jgi:endonuclease/exonuclease/phosphatase family metal-dependent hydrolase